MLPLAYYLALPPLVQSPALPSGIIKEKLMGTGESCIHSPTVLSCSLSQCSGLLVIALLSLCHPPTCSPVALLSHSPSYLLASLLFAFSMLDLPSVYSPIPPLDTTLASNPAPSYLDTLPPFALPFHICRTAEEVALALLLSRTGLLPPVQRRCVDCICTNMLIHLGGILTFLLCVTVQIFLQTSRGRSPQTS